ncbi:MLO-like protein 11 [Helianthus annuus]|uniref:MLO-like protein 11 n=1 Tax=Helianthus annuus TaxID=4232 RepID=UPI001652CFCD|nr:MLO-like protein 11 [Helianthus annuus]
MFFTLDLVQYADFLNYPKSHRFWSFQIGLPFFKPRFVVQFLCSYSTLPMYALDTQMGTNYKAESIPQRTRDTIHGWGKEARRRRKRFTFSVNGSKQKGYAF